jgi:hypothetical protein
MSSKVSKPGPVEHSGRLARCLKEPPQPLRNDIEPKQFLGLPLKEFRNVRQPIAGL